MSKDRSISGGTVAPTGGFPTGRGASANRLPTAPRERKPALAALAVLLILAGALSTMLLVTRSGNRISVVRMKNTVVAGQKITQNDIQEWQVAADPGINYVLYSQRGGLSVTNNTLVKGSLLTGDMLGATGQTSIPKGQVVVGVQVKPGHYPFQWLSLGDQVTVYGTVAPSSSNTAGGTGSSSALPPELGTALIVYIGHGDTMSATLATSKDVAEKIIAAGDSITIAKTIGS